MKRLISDLARRPVTSLRKIVRGRNSRVYRVTCGRAVYAAKLYFPREGRLQTRMEAEYEALQFLHDHGVRCVPRPIAADRDAHIALYEHIRGTAVPSSRVTPSDVDAAVRFLATLASLRHAPDSSRLPEAAEACFSLKMIVGSILRRLTRLRSAASEHAALRVFLRDDLVPTLHETARGSHALLRAERGRADAMLSRDERVLSPSDFGFHNAIRRPDGGITFLDFEYFGWDDPAKTISDFLLHPAMDLKDSLRRRFLSGMLAALPHSDRLRRRLKAVFPLFGLKWCTILLNEFVPQDFQRRTFARDRRVSRGRLLEIQLLKSRTLLKRIQCEWRTFPYEC